MFPQSLIHPLDSSRRPLQSRKATLHSAPDTLFLRQNEKAPASSNIEVRDESDLQRLYDEHAQALFAFLLNLTRDEQDTRDLLQGIFVRLAERPELLADVRDERAFLIRLAHNAAIDLMRRSGTREKYRDAYGREPISVFASAANPDEQSFRETLGSALGELPPEQRAVVHLKLWEGLTFEEIAESLGMSLNTAASRYRYGLDKLRERLRPLYEEIK